jgi:hypothetical protein
LFRDDRREPPKEVTSIDLGGEILEEHRSNNNCTLSDDGVTIDPLLDDYPRPQAESLRHEKSGSLDRDGADPGIPCSVSERMLRL